MYAKSFRLFHLSISISIKNHGDLTGFVQGINIALGTFLIDEKSCKRFELRKPSENKCKQKFSPGI